MSNAQGQQGVAGEDRGRLVEGVVNGRLSAAQVVIVHRRQVVMDQRIAVYAFQRGASPHRGVQRAAQHQRRFDNKERAHAACRR